MTDRGLAREATPLLGGLAILAGVLLAAALFLPVNRAHARASCGGSALITLVGALDDLRDIPAGLKLTGQFARRP